MIRGYCVRGEEDYIVRNAIKSRAKIWAASSVTFPRAISVGSPLSNHASRVTLRRYGSRRTTNHVCASDNALSYTDDIHIRITNQSIWNSREGPFDVAPMVKTFFPAPGAPIVQPNSTPSPSMSLSAPVFPAANTSRCSGFCENVEIHRQIERMRKRETLSNVQQKEGGLVYLLSLHDSSCHRRVNSGWHFSSVHAVNQSSIRVSAEISQGQASNRHPSPASLPSAYSALVGRKYRYTVDDPYFEATRVGTFLSFCHTLNSSTSRGRARGFERSICLSPSACLPSILFLRVES